MEFYNGDALTTIPNKSTYIGSVVYFNKILSFFFCFIQLQNLLSVQVPMMLY